MSEEIITKIKDKLKEIEEKENIRIIHCVESGSRAWGFASPDSDYDVRFIYVRPIEYYLKLEKTRDIIEWELNDVYDINGWDIKKTLELLHKSNPTLFEWNNSPLVYKTTPEWETVRTIITKCFMSKSGVYHYLSTAKHNYKAYLTGNEVKYKKYFYVLRPLLACKWILDNGTPPPMLFSELMETELEESMRPEVERLLELKMNTPEIGKGKKIAKLNQFLLAEMDEVQHRADKMDGEKPVDWQVLDDVFLKLLNNSSDKKTENRKYYCFFG